MTCGQIVQSITIIPECHHFHFNETQFTIQYIVYLPLINFQCKKRKKKNPHFLTIHDDKSCIVIHWHANDGHAFMWFVPVMVSLIFYSFLASTLRFIQGRGSNMKQGRARICTPHTISTVYTVNSEIFASTLFSRNFAYAKFRENKALAKWQITWSFIDIGNCCLSRKCFTSLICLLMIFAKIKFSWKFPNLQYMPTTFHPKGIRVTEYTRLHL